MRGRSVVSGEGVTDDTPLRLDEAARLAFPDGSISGAALRRAGRAGKLAIERIAGKDYTTLAHIRAMRERCRVVRAPPDRCLLDMRASMEAAKAALSALKRA